MRIKLLTQFNNPNITQYVKSETVARDSFTYARAVDKTEEGDLDYIVWASAGTPVWGSGGTQLTVLSGLGPGVTTFCAVDSGSIADTAQIGVYGLGTGNGAQVLICADLTFQNRIVAARVSSTDPRWRLVRYEDGVNVGDLVVTDIDMTAGNSAFRRTVEGGQLVVRINDVVVWRGRPYGGALFGAGLNVASGDSPTNYKFDYLSINVEA